MTDTPKRPGSLWWCVVVLCFLIPPVGIALFIIHWCWRKWKDTSVSRAQ